jgi:hypothetical protein
MADTDHPQQASVVWRPQPGPQTELLSCPPSIGEVLYGGARGGGKTDALLGDFVAHASRHGDNAIGLMLRRTLVQLTESIERSRALYTPLGARYNASEKMWTFSNGARLRFAYLESDSDADNYQGHSYSRLYIDEIGNFPSERPVKKLMATLRSGAGVPVRFIATANPGGVGHHWVKRRYIDPAPNGRQILVDPETGLKRVFIPSKVADNRYLGPEYVERLKASGSEQLVRGWLNGDWSVIEGAFFGEWETARHVIEPFPIPEGWTLFRATDWGFAVPSATLWFAVVGDDTEHGGRTIPRGSLIAYREWYTCSGQPNIGQRLTAEELGRGIRQREHGEKIVYGVLDPACWAESGGPSIAERLARVGVIFRRADNRRLGQVGHMGGWDQMRSRLKQGTLMFFDSCVHTIRTVPMLAHDPDRAEDLDTQQEDHAADACRYGCMSRPFITKPPAPPKPGPRVDERGVWVITVDELLKIHEGRDQRQPRV